MSTATVSPVFLVDAYSDPVYLKIKGRASYLNCEPLNKFFSKIIEKPKVNIVVDFAECSGMDSTFLGLLAGVSLEIKKKNQDGSICLYSVKGRNRELMANLGLDQIITVDSDEYKPTANENLEKKFEKFESEQSASIRTILQAHQHLISADSSNLNRFQDVVSFLKKQINQDL